MATNRLLVVEGDPGTRRLVAAVFGCMGWQVSLPRSVDEAIMALDPAPAYIVLDPRFPHGDAGELVRVVRSRRLPCRIVASLTVDDTDWPGRHGGRAFDAVLRKPTDTAGMTRTLTATVGPADRF